MRYLYLAALVLGISAPTLSQRTMITHNHDGTKEFIRLSAVDSVTFEEFIPVAGGSFASTSFTDGVTSTTVSSFTIDKYEVTYGKWTAVKTWGLANGYTDLVDGMNGYSPVGLNNPVCSVNWYDAVKWCNARSVKDGLTPVYYTDFAQTTVYKIGTVAINTVNVKWSANGYRLPTEAEWEFAAIGGTLSNRYLYSGSNAVDDVAWYGIESTHPVGGKRANELGIYDMSGNAYEWCWDWYGERYPNIGSTDPRGPTTTQAARIVRGGSFNSPDYLCHPEVRNDYDPNFRINNLVGFRCVQD